MPYYHIKDKGEILFWQRRCTKCHKRWPWYTLFLLTPPKDMKHYVAMPTMPEIKKGQTAYAKWADKAPGGAATLASRLPNWPRWARILSLVIFVAILATVAYLLFGRR